MNRFCHFTEKSDQIIDNFASISFQFETILLNFNDFIKCFQLFSVFCELSVYLVYFVVLNWLCWVVRTIVWTRNVDILVHNWKLAKNLSSFAYFLAKNYTLFRFFDSAFLVFHSNLVSLNLFDFAPKLIYSVPVSIYL